MTRRICFLGNSHLACVAQALRQSSALPPGRYDVFASIGGSEPKVTYENGKLLPAHDKARECFQSSANGKTEIVLADYDVFAIVAAGLPAVRAQFPHPFKNVVMSWIDGATYPAPADLGQRAYVSRDCAQTLIANALDRHGAIGAVRDIAQHTGKPIIVVSCPLPDQKYVHGADNIFSVQHGAQGLAHWAEWSRLHRHALKTTISGISGRIRLLEQPAETLASCGLATLSDFETTDAWHMNAAYGQIVLDHILKAAEAY